MMTKKNSFLKWFGFILVARFCLLYQNFENLVIFNNWGNLNILKCAHNVILMGKKDKCNCKTIKSIKNLPFWVFWDALSMESFRLTFLISVFSNFCRLTLATGWCKSTTRSWKTKTNSKFSKIRKTITS